MAPRLVLAFFLGAVIAATLGLFSVASFWPTDLVLRAASDGMETPTTWNALYSSLTGKSLDQAFAAIAATGAAVSAYAALKSIRLSGEQAQQQREAQRPYFSFEEVKMEPQRGPQLPGNVGPPPIISNHFVVRGVMINRGLRPALRLRGQAFAIDSQLAGPPLSAGGTMADEFPPGAQWSLSPGGQVIQQPNHPGYFLVVGVSYFDFVTQKNYAQLFFMRWPGVTNGTVAGDFQPASAEDAERIKAKYRAALIGFL